MIRCWLWLTAALFALSSCGAEKPPATTAAAPQGTHPSLEHRQLEDYVPAAGLRWLVVSRLREIAETTWLRQSLDQLFPEERLDAYAAATGLDLRESEQALVAGFDFGTLYLAQTSTANSRVETLFRNRLPAGPVEHRAHPDVLVLSGMIRETPTALVSQQGHLIGVAFGDPTLARIVEAYARGRLESATALQGAALATLPDSVNKAPLRFYAPGPFERDWQMGARGILGAATAVSVTAQPLRPDIIRVGVVVAGDWSDDGRGARAKAMLVYEDLATSSLGRLLALDEPIAPPIVTVAPESIRLSVDLALGPLVGGLHAAVSADLWELLHFPVAPAGSSQSESTSQ